MGALLSALASNLINFFANYYTATKIVLTTLIITVLPIVLYNLIYEIADEVLRIVEAQLSSFSSSDGIDFSSLPALGHYLMTEMRLYDAFSIVLSAILVRFSLNIIPFVRV